MVVNINQTLYRMAATNYLTSTTNYWTATAFATTPPVITHRFTEKHTPGFKLTNEERDIKMDQHKYGLCSTCDAGLDDRADFVCNIQMRDNLAAEFFGLMCNACHDYYTDGPSYAIEDN
jgi:hypothetical protein